MTRATTYSDRWTWWWLALGLGLGILSLLRHDPIVLSSAAPFEATYSCANGSSDGQNIQLLLSGSGTLHARAE